MAPYRSSPRASAARESDRADERAEERALAWLLLVIGAIRVAIGVAEREVFRTEATVAMLMVAAAVGLLACRTPRTR
jgi:hypothetical protein